FKEVRRLQDPIYKHVFAEGRFHEGMRFVEKVAVLGEVERNLIEIREGARKLDKDAVRKEYGVHPSLNCPDLDAADAMYESILRIAGEGDSSGGVVEVVATGLPAGMGEPVFAKLDGELGRMMSIGAVKAVEVGAGVQVKDMTGSQGNDQIFSDKGRVYFGSNHAGGTTGGLTTGQDLIARVVVKPTPTIAKDQHTIDKVTKENAVLSAVTRRDPTIVPRVWPVVEAFAAIIVLDQYMQHKAYRALWAEHAAK
ncbi:MAG: chorismate synthase, partial [Candidatus Sumerlaeota bacterium]|nr:chorismate synthase [Candidatus Sumerlaeota bacterium]